MDFRKRDSPDGPRASGRLKEGVARNSSLDEGLESWLGWLEEDGVGVR